MLLPEMVRRSVFSHPPEPEAVRQLVEYCHRLARSQVGREVRTRKYSVSAHFGLSIHDLALDCVADLFERDDHNRFTQLLHYFEAEDWESLPPPALQAALHRLVFSKVNDGLFRRHREADPNLARIIRNIKLAARGTSGLHLTRYQRDTWLFTMKWQEDPSAEPQPMAPPSVLKTYLVSWLDGSSQIPHSVKALCAFTSAHPIYIPGYPVTQFAQLVRAAFAHLHPTGEDAVAPDQRLSLQREDTVAAIRHAVRMVQQDMYEPYVGRGKVSGDMFQAYLRAIRDVLISVYVDPNRKEESLFEALSRYLRDLQHDEYRTEHRHRVEYLMKKTRPIFVAEMKRCYA